MSDPVATRAAGSTRSVRGGAPQKTKAEKKAEAKAAKARARARQKQRQALTVGGAAVLVLVVVVGLAVWIGSAVSGPDEAAPPAAGATSAAATGAAFPPLPAGADPALGTKPTVGAGTGPVAELTTTSIIKGTGAAVAAGQTVNVNYVGVTYADGQEFDSSWSRTEPFSFAVGAGEVIKGWDQGLVGVTVGSRVQLDIPADLAYGENPGGGRPGGTLRFVIDVLSAT